CMMHAAAAPPPASPGHARANHYGARSGPPRPARAGTRAVTLLVGSGRTSLDPHARERAKGRPPLEFWRKGAAAPRQERPRSRQMIDPSRREVIAGRGRRSARLSSQVNFDGVNAIRNIALAAWLGNATSHPIP